MIEIENRNGIWEAHVEGSLFHYSNSLEDFLLYLSNNVESIKDEFYEER